LFRALAAATRAQTQQAFGVMDDDLVIIPVGQIPAQWNGGGVIVAIAQSVGKCPAGFAEQTAGVSGRVHFFKTDMLKLGCSSGTN
jgi:hypothetical protein